MAGREQNESPLTPDLLAGRKIAADDSWIDLFVGLKGRAFLNGNRYIAGRGWSPRVAIQIHSGMFSVVWAMEFSDVVSLVGGYRHQEVDYQNGDFLFDVEMSGPMLGLTFRF